MHAVLALCAAIVILPAVWIGFAAFKTQIALLRGDVLFTPYLGNFDELLFSRSADYVAHFANSLIVASVSTVARAGRRDAGRVLDAPPALAAAGCRRWCSRSRSCST